jgi:hypothetical protein
MTIKEITLTRSTKWGQYNKEMASMSMTIETSDYVKETREAWEYINAELTKQIEGEDKDPDWIKEGD